MSKTITIPTNCNPYIVVINNHVYAYKAGDTIEVPDEVAEAIEDALELVPKPKRYPSRLAQLAEGSLQEITAEDLAGISAIGTCAFYSNFGVRKATIPNNIGEIKSNAFAWCTNIAKMYLPEVPPTLADINAFNGINAACVFYCKTQASLDAYKAAPNWSTLTGTYSFVVEA